jgi:hypothetical protein
MDKKGAQWWITCQLRYSLIRPVEIDRALTPGVRCTVELEHQKHIGSASQIKGKAAISVNSKRRQWNVWG